MKNIQKFSLLSLMIVLLSSCSHVVFVWTFKDAIVLFFISCFIIFGLYFIIKTVIKNIINNVKKLFGGDKKPE